MKKAYAVVILTASLLAGCSSTSRRPPVEVFADMDRQHRYNPQVESALFPDGRASRPPVAGTVARGEFKEDESIPARNPLSVNAAVLAEGQQRFNIYCAPCHDRTGSGQGIVALRAGWLASNVTEQRVREFSDGELFDVITHGRRTMPAYRFQVAERDRWAIVAYVRALQRAAAGTIEDVPQELRDEVR